MTTKAGAGATVAPGADLRGSVERVVRSDNCSGCGACARLSTSISMELDAEGFIRPIFPLDDRPDDPTASRTFAQICPGVAVTSPATAAIPDHETLGPAVSAWTAWAVDPEYRFAGSSAGVLSALSSFLMRTGEATSVVGAAMSADSPRRTVPLELRTKADVLSASGSRYAPVANASLFDPARADRAFVGKPCEVYAARKLCEETSGASPVLLSFFCAGVPSQFATDDLVAAIAADRGNVASVRYRGNGWPGSFVVRDAGGATRSTSYEDSWGNHLGRRLQERCKICPDGTGGHADIAVGDYWHADASGFPLFDDADGLSVAIARTARGHRLLMSARDAGVLGLEPVDLDAVAAVQPLQVKRRRTLLGRLAGRRLAGRAVPRYSGFRLLRLAVSSPGDSVRAARGTFSRTRRRRQKVAT
ncbi:Coenzyme F420 hydrogenase/dehydrogenase, beta subunit C-terminal domain [Nakamurella sp. GG22]